MTKRWGDVGLFDTWLHSAHVRLAVTPNLTHLCPKLAGFVCQFCSGRVSRNWQDRRIVKLNFRCLRRRLSVWVSLKAQTLSKMKTTPKTKWNVMYRTQICFLKEFIFMYCDSISCMWGPQQAEQRGVFGSFPGRQQFGNVPSNSTA